MIVMTLIFMTISLITFVIINERKDCFWLCGVFIGFILSNIGLMFYYSKMGGLILNEQILFFLSLRLQHLIQNASVTLNQVARIINIGKILFTYFTVIFSLNLTNRLHSYQPLLFICAVWPLFNLFFNDPSIYLLLLEQQKVLIDYSCLLQLLIYSIFTIILLIREYFNHSFGIIKRKLRYIIIFVTNMILYFLFFCQINATSVFYSNHIRFQNLSFKVYQLRFSLFSWFLVICLFLFFLIVGLNSLFFYTKINKDEDQENFTLERQLRTADMGTKVFMHGLKNQLLAEHILLKRAKQEIANADLQKIQNHINELEKLNETLTLRIDALYKAFKYSSMTLSPHYTSEIIDLSMEKITKKVHTVTFNLLFEQDSLVLSDSSYLSEAIYNILTNALDAIQDSVNAEHGQISITVKKDSRWCNIFIEDNGIGISKEKMSHIFDPFYTDKNTNYCWGIGLSHVKQIVKYHFGKIVVESTEGKGSCFQLILPIYIESDSRKPFFKIQTKGEHI